MHDDYEFTADWFSQAAPVWRSMIAGIKPRRALEVGSFEGRGAVCLVENCAPFGHFELTCIDNWSGDGPYEAFDIVEVEARFDRNMARAKAKHDCTIVKLKADTTLAMARLLANGQAESFDVAYVDASHQAPDVLSDAVLAFKRLRVGGAIIFDDYLWHLEPAGQQDLLKMPKLAIDSFVNTHFRKLGIVADAPLRQLNAIKTAN